MDPKTLVDHCLQEAKVMQVATVADGKPWVATVNFAPDENRNLYWMSLRSTTHSQHIKNNPNIAGAIVKDADRGQGLQFEGTAAEAVGKDLEKANEVFEIRYGHKPERLEEAKSQDETKRTYYKITPTRFVVFDKTNPAHPRQEFVL